MTIHQDDPLGVALIDLTEHLRQIRAFYIVLERRLPAEDPLVKLALKMHTQGQQALVNLCASLMEAGVLAGGPELPDEPPIPGRVLQ
jgi:hypothetical protein